MAAFVRQGLINQATTDKLWIFTQVNLSAAFTNEKKILHELSKA